MNTINLILLMLKRGVTILLMGAVWRHYIVHPDKWDKMPPKEFGALFLLCLLFAVCWHDFREEEKK